MGKGIINIIIKNSHFTNNQVQQKGGAIEITNEES